MLVNDSTTLKRVGVNDGSYCSMMGKMQEQLSANRVRGLIFTVNSKWDDDDRASAASSLLRNFSYDLRGCGLMSTCIMVKNSIALLT